MSKEEVLLELVVDKFTNIKKVLNSTKDIENFLIKLKLNKRKGIGLVLNKTKNLVDSLYDHSVKIKDEFYEHYNKLESISSENVTSQDSDGNIIEENAETVSQNDESEIFESAEDSAENEGDIIECSNVEDNEEIHSDNTASEQNNPELSLEDPLSVPVNAGSRILGNEGGNVIEHNSAEENGENSGDDITPAENNPEPLLGDPSEDPLEESSGSEIVDNILNDSVEDANNDDTDLENSYSKSNNSKEAAEKTVNSNAVDSILGSSKENIDEEELLIDKEDQNGEGTTEVKEEPKALIRLVDLSKLIDPKPKKSVKFDSSVIILTSSDEDSNTPKKKTDIRDKSGKLKSALKNSPLNKNNQELYNEKSKAKAANKSKHNSKRDVVNLDLTEESDNDTIKRKSLRSKENTSRDNPSDSEESSMDSKKNNEESPIGNSRRSSRIDNRLSVTQKRRENLRKIFKRKSTKSGRSNFEIVNDKSKDDNSDEDSDSNTARKRKSSRKKKDLREEHLSDTSSLSDDENEDIHSKNKSKSSKKKKHRVDVSIGVGTDKKFSYEVHIPLPRIECCRLKDIYLNNKEILEMKSLTNVNLPKTSKRSRAAKNDSNSSSDNEKPKNKKSKNNSSKDKNTSEDNQSSDNEPETNDIDKDVNKNISESSRLENDDEKMVEIVMEKLNNSEKTQDKSESDDSGSEERQKKSENKKNKEKSKETDNKEEVEENEDNTQTENENDEDAKQNSESDGSNDGQEKKDKKWRKDKLLTSKIDSSDSEEEFSKYSKKKSKSREEILRKAKKRGKNAILISDSDDSGDGKKKNNEESSNESKSSDEKSNSDDSEQQRKKEKKKKKVKKKSKKAKVISDSDDSGNDKKKNDDESSNDSKSSDEKSDNSEKERDKEEDKKKRRRIKRTKDSSSSDEEKSTRKQIRRLIGKGELSETTKQAEAEEKERKARIAEKQRKYNKFFESQTDSKVEKVVLDYDEKHKKELISVHKGLVKKLKPHQASGVQFMWDACYESLERTKSTKGSGCILAHCMGLGKTLQVIALTHTLLTHSEKTGVTKVMVVCPLNTVLNWKAEFKKWLPKNDLEIYELVSCKQNYERQYVVQEWHNDGGVLIIGYHMFRNLSNPDNKRISKKVRNVFHEGLLDPGPDLVICDEGHLLKNEKTHLSIAMNRIKTARRIVLTGTPLQNNLKEYWCMVQFIKPNLLGTYKEYLNRFVNPIINGQYTDSTQHDILLMRKRSHVLHKLLDGVVQRRDYAVLEPYLPPKHEYVLFIALTETQVKLYKHYMEKFARQNDGSNRTSFLFTDFQSLQRICTHPRVLFDKTNERKEKDDDEEESEGSLRDFIDDDEASESDSSNSSSSSNSNSGSEDSNNDKKQKKSKSQQKVRLTRALAAQRKENNEEDSEPEVEEIVRKEWWQEYCDGEELDNINNSGKLFLLFQILKECEEIGDKILVFSQSLYTLNCIEYFLEKIDEATQKGESDKVGGHSGSWAIGLDYFRLDGSSSCDNRATWCDMFNNPDNIRARLFLISTKAGGLGINLVAANRVIIFDVSWNPSHDIQSIYRVYRFGQTKPCYIYRFVAYGTMEMKVYERQVTKQAISKRVIDEQQIDRHYNQNDLQELYQCDLEPTDRPIPLVPKDVLLGEMLQKYDKTIYKYHLHQSLLENKEAEGLNEEERKAAWEEFENEKVLRKNTSTIGNFGNSFMSAQAIEAALASIVRKDNPTWSDVQIKGIIPALVQQLQVQLAEGDVTMYARVQQEMQMMQALHAQKLKEAYYQQQVMRLIQQQEQQAKILGNMNINPAQLARTQSSMLSHLLAQRQGGPSSAPPSRPVSNDVIELND